MYTDRMPPMHPGEYLREEFLEPLEISANALAMALRVPTTRITEILHERRGITPDTAMRLSFYFDTSAAFWINLQAAYDLRIAETSTQKAIKREIKPYKEVALKTAKAVASKVLSGGVTINSKRNAKSGTFVTSRASVKSHNSRKATA